VKHKQIALHCTWYARTKRTETIKQCELQLTIGDSNLESRERGKDGLSKVYGRKNEVCALNGHMCYL